MTHRSSFRPAPSGHVFGGNPFFSSLGIWIFYSLAHLGRHRLKPYKFRLICKTRKNMKKAFKNFIYFPIGIIHSPFKKIEGMPIQPAAAEGIKGKVEIYDEYANGLKDLEGFSHIILLYHFHLSAGFSLEVIPFLDDQARGVFATRAPRRPNPIGFSIVKLDRREENVLYIENVDIVDGTPLLDIKPYVREFDSLKGVKLGWLAKHKGAVSTRRSDKRFK
jgi:tRNA-Thr(GGU) m(6)t(6)A37 methyltransferase TsaA